MPEPTTSADPAPPAAAATPIGDEQLANAAIVLDLVRSGEARSRADLTRKSGLGRAVLQRTLDDLLQRGLIEDGGVAESTGGRPSTLLDFCARAGYLIGIDLGLSSVDVGITDLAGTLLGQRGETATLTPDPESTLHSVDVLLRDLLDNTPGMSRLWGIGVGVPTRIESQSHRPTATPDLAGWNAFPLQEVLVARYGAPVWVDNDVNVMALAELHMGSARGQKHMIFVKVGTGIGASLVLEGRLYRGSEGLAGDLGHIQVSDDRSIVCTCGRYGCLEALAGGRALERDGEAAAREGRSAMLGAVLAAKGHVEASDLVRAAHQGDTTSVELLTRAGRTIGRALADLVNVLNPAQIIVGGGVAGANDLLLAAIRGEVYAYSRPLATRNLLIQHSALTGRGGVIGAARLAADALFSRESLALWLGDGYPQGSRFLVNA